MNMSMTARWVLFNGLIRGLDIDLDDGLHDGLRNGFYNTLYYKFNTATPDGFCDAFDVATDHELRKLKQNFQAKPENPP